MLGDNSREGKEALARNFDQARKAIRDSIDRGVTKTEDGMAAIERLMVEELQTTYGLTLRQAKGLRKNQKAGRGPQGLAGPAGGETQRGGRIPTYAAGGWIHGKGLVG